MAVSKASILFFKYDESDLISFVSLSSNVKSCNSCLNSTKFFLRLVVASDLLLLFFTRPLPRDGSMRKTMEPQKPGNAQGSGPEIVKR